MLCAHNQIRHMSKLIVQRSNDGHGNVAGRANQWRRDAIGNRVVFQTLQEIVEGMQEQLAWLSISERATTLSPLQVTLRGGFLLIWFWCDDVGEMLLVGQQLNLHLWWMLCG